MSTPPNHIGFIYGWKGGNIYVLVSNENYKPAIGDLLYVIDGKNRYYILQVTGFEGEIPAPPSSLIREAIEAPVLYGISKSIFAKTTLFLEIRDYGGQPIAFKPSEPPSLDTKVYLLDKSSLESRAVMEKLSRGIIHPGSTESIAIAWLRTGVAPVEQLRREKYFAEAPLRLDLSKLITKHVLIAGQTGSGKTTGLMGMITSWCLEGRGRLSWLIIDKHGEYHSSDYIDTLVKALKSNSEQNGVKISIYILDVNKTDSKIMESVETFTTPVALSSLDIADLANVTNLPTYSISELEELINTISELIEIEDDESYMLLNLFFDKNRSGSEPRLNGNVLGLIPLLIDNMIKYEGVGEREKWGLYRELLREGIDIRKLRVFRRIILSTLGLSVRTERVEASGRNIGITVLDDSKTVFKVPDVLKNPRLLIRVLQKIAKEVEHPYHGYPWFNVKFSDNVGPTTTTSSLSIDELVEKLGSGTILILDLSKIPIYQGDLIVMSIIRRVFETRVASGVDKVSEMPIVAIVSEEAPLYLSPDKIDNPYNIFARVAREGRKFGLGLIAITQIATIIEKQILANFNTVIALRTKHPGDLNFYSEMGLPTEAMPLLNDREGYIYTPDLNVKEPLPVYIPGYMDLKQTVLDKYNSRTRSFEVTRKVLDKISQI
ncbi:MAG: DUF87 domain-containing protein [Desulfurococcaceae archaeon]